jgi:hypothetical protein
MYDLLIILLVSSQSSSHGGQPCNEFKGYALAHKGKARADIDYNPEDGPEAYSNPSVHTRLTEYTSMAREVHGPDFDPTTEDLDVEVVMRVGGGKKHGRYWIADSAIDPSSAPTLSQIQARSTSSSPAIRPRASGYQALQVIVSLSYFTLYVDSFFLCITVTLGFKLCSNNSKKRGTDVWSWRRGVNSWRRG